MKIIKTKTLKTLKFSINMSVTNLYTDTINAITHSKSSGSDDDDDSDGYDSSNDSYDSSNDGYDSSNDDGGSINVNDHQSVKIPFSLNGNLGITCYINGQKYTADCDLNSKCCETSWGVVEYDDEEYNTSGDVFSISVPYNSSITLKAKLISKTTHNHDYDTRMIIRIGPVRIVFGNIHNGYYSHRPSLSVNDTELTYAII